MNEKVIIDLDESPSDAGWILTPDQVEVEVALLDAIDEKDIKSLYLTSFTRDGKRWIGPDIEADSFSEAEGRIADAMHVDGELVTEWEIKGGKGSGNFGHAGRHGKVGGSSPGVFASRIESSSVSLGNTRKLEGAFPSVVDDEEFLGSQVESLVDRMRDEHGDYDEETFEEINYDYVGDTVTDWNIESDRGGALFLHVGASQELDVPLSEYIEDKVRSGGGNPSLEFGEEKRLAAVLYRDTQDYLRRRGFSPDDKVVLYRGSTRNISGSGLSGNPLESWTTSRDVAEFYVQRKGHGVVLMTEIPVRDVFALPQTGLGLVSVYEVVILGSNPHDVVSEEV